MRRGGIVLATAMLVMAPGGYTLGQDEMRYPSPTLETASPPRLSRPRPLFRQAKSLRPARVHLARCCLPRCSATGCRATSTGFPKPQDR